MRILVVEDEHLIANSIKKGLEQEKFTVDVAFDGETGFDLASNEAYDLIILDLMLPKMDGMTICQELRKANIHTPILMLTAKSQIQDKIAGLNNGADDYLAKPFSFEELLARSRALGRRPAQFKSTILKVANLTLDSKTFQVMRDNQPIELSNKEFKLLEYLMSNSGRILTKEEIIEHVWDYDSDILPNTIEVYVRNLRNKIDLPFKGSALIKTVRGFGYKLE